jgi:hypothetical protein
MLSRLLFNAKQFQQFMHKPHYPPKRPRTNGKTGRFIQTLLREWAYRLQTIRTRRFPAPNHTWRRAGRLRPDSRGVVNGANGLEQRGVTAAELH